MSNRGVAQRSHAPKRVQKDTSWQEHAVCVDCDPELFFDPAREVEAKMVCAGCPVKLPCREYGKGQAAGVWGGMVRSNHRPPGVQQFLLQPHGTEAAYRRHRRNGEQPCGMCLVGSARAKAARS